MSVTAPPTIDALPAAPDPNNRTTYNALAYPWSAAQGVFGTQVAAVAANVFANATAAAASAGSAATQAGLAATDGAAQVALAVTQAGIATTKAGLTAADALATAADREQTGSDRVAAAASAASAAAIAGAFVGTSASSLAIAAGSKTFTTQAGEQYSAGIWMTAVSRANPANWMFGEVTSYSGTTLVIDVQTVGGSGTCADWNLSLAGPRGAQGIPGPAGTLSGTAVGAVDLLTGANIASAATVNFDSATGNRVHITGTTTITAVTLTRGPRTVIFDGALTLTHHATNNNLPGGANIVTAAGDRAIYESDGTTVYCVDYIKASGAAIVGGVSLIRSPRTANTILGVADNGKLIDIISGTFTQTFTAAATLGNGWYCYLRNSGTGDITLDPNGLELIDSLNSYVVYPGECRLIQCNESSFTSVVVSPFYRSITSSITFVAPPGYRSFGARAWGAGGAGRGGMGGPAGTNRFGAAGGGGGGYNHGFVDLAAGANVTVTVAAAAMGGYGGDSGMLGPVGGNGGNSSFGTSVIAYGGCGGGQAGTTEGGGGGGATSAAMDSNGGGPNMATGSSTNLGSTSVYARNNIGFGGGASVGNTGASATAGKVGTTEFGGSGGGCANAGAVGGAKSAFGATGGGAGGSLNISNAVSFAPGAGGGVGYDTSNAGGGATNGANGVAQGPLGSGGGGAGGVANPSGFGGAGGAGATPGGGGGGGAAGLISGGNGGNGGAGLVIVWGVA